MITLSSRPILNSTVVGRVVDDGAVLVLPEQGQVKVLNEVGAHIWSLADGLRTVRDIVKIICQEYAVEPAQAETDTLEFLNDLIERQIIFLHEEMQP